MSGGPAKGCVGPVGPKGAFAAGVAARGSVPKPSAKGIRRRVLYLRALGFVVIEFFRFLETVEHVELAVHEDGGGAGEPLQGCGLV